MPKICSVCSHERRVEIDRAIHRGTYSSEIGRRFNLTTPTISGHRRSAHHLLQSPRQMDTATPHTALSLLTRISANLDDDDALGDLRIAVGSLPPVERRLLVEELRARAGRGKVPAMMKVA